MKQPKITQKKKLKEKNKNLSKKASTVYSMALVYSYIFAVQ
jgi:hypothetical protein